MSNKNVKIEFMGLNKQGIVEFLKSHGIKQSFRADQILRWIYNHRILDFEEMTNLPGSVRDILKEFASLSLPAQIEAFKDGNTVRFLFKDDNSENPVIYESVLIIEKRSDGHIRQTACISSQAGCNLGCKFCATARMGLQRNLEASEIIGQLFYMQNFSDLDAPLTNVVFMGMGEPLQNIDNVLQSISIIKSDPGFGIGARKITVSTAGIVPEIYRLSVAGHKVRLAISLNASNDELRKQLMPIAEKYSIDEILEAAQAFYKATGRWVTLEYVIIDSINDSMDFATELSEKIADFDVKVNLIPYNPIEELEYSKPSMGKIQQFQAILLANGITATIRNSQGSNINAACGQLAGKYR